MTERRDREHERLLREEDRVREEEQAKRRDETERRGEELREAWRRHHPRGEGRDQPKEKKP